MDSKTKRPIQLNQDGFTIIEIIIAITMLSFLMIAMYSLVDDNTKTKERVVSEDREYMQVQMALSRFSQDFTQIYSPLYFSSSTPLAKKNGDEETSDTPKTKIKFTPSERFPEITLDGRLVPMVDSDSKDHLSFMSTSNRRKIQDSKQSQYAWIQYSVDTIETTDQDGNKKSVDAWTRIVLAMDPYGKEQVWEKGKPQFLLKNIKSLAYQFWNKKAKKWVDSLKELPKIERMAPVGVKVNLVWIDKSGNENQVSRVFRPLWPYFDVKKDQLESVAKSNEQDREEDDE